MGRRQRLFGFLVLVLLWTSDAAAQPVRDVVVVGMEAEPPGLDPGQALGLHTLRVTYQIFETLVTTPDDSTDVVPGLAESPDSRAVLLADLADFVTRHRPCGLLTGDATEPAPDGYLVTVELLLRRHVPALGHAGGGGVRTGAVGTPHDRRLRDAPSGFRCRGWARHRATALSPS